MAPGRGITQRLQIFCNGPNGGQRATDVSRVSELPPVATCIYRCLFHHCTPPSPLHSTPMQSALTPNTAAFLEYISPGHAPTSAPPAALFNNMPVPGRDTPEDTPPSVSNSSQPSAHQAPSDDSDSPTPEMPPAQPDDAANTDPLAGNGANKRKAGRPSAVLDDDDDDG